MKILAINSSPRKKGQSKTELMLSHLVTGMQTAGAEVETIDLRDKKIGYCAGCFSCWSKTPGKCIQKDDMTGDLFPKWLASDLVVYASPLYHYHLNAQMKAFIERTLPILEPFLLDHQGRTHHPLRARHPKMVLLSVAGFPEMQVFDQLTAWVNSVYGQGGPLMAEIYRPAAESMRSPSEALIVSDILTATKLAGSEIVESQQINPATLARIQQDLVQDKQSRHLLANLFWKTCIDESATPQEFEKRGLIPRPDSIESFLLILAMGFNPEKAADTSASMQFDFSGEVAGHCHFIIEKGTIITQKGSAENAGVVIKAPFELWMDILTGKANGQQMFMEKKYSVTGDLNLLIAMNTLFGK